MSCQFYDTLHPGNELSINTEFKLKVKWTSFASVTAETVTSVRASGGGLNLPPTQKRGVSATSCEVFWSQWASRVEGPDPRMITQLVTASLSVLSLKRVCLDGLSLRKLKIWLRSLKRKSVVPLTSGRDKKKNLDISPLGKSKTLSLSADLRRWSDSSSSKSYVFLRER